MDIDSYKNYSKPILRYGLGLVFIWFGINQFQYPSRWTYALPSFFSSFSIDPETFIYFNAAFDLTFGILLILGFFVRFVSFALCIHLLAIIFSVGFNGAGVRDFGLLTACLAIFLNGKDNFCLDNKKFKKIKSLFN